MSRYIVQTYYPATNTYGIPHFVYSKEEGYKLIRQLSTTFNCDCYLSELVYRQHTRNRGN